MLENKFVTVLVVGDTEKTVLASAIDSNGDIHRGKAVCAEGDKEKYRPVIGAIIALCKAMGVNPVKACYDVMDVYAQDEARKLEKAKQKEAEAKVVVHKRKSNGKDKARPCVCGSKRACDINGVPVYKVKAGYCELVPVGLLATEPGVRSYGRMGDYTRFYDKNGDRLHVGDLVAVDIREGDVRTGKKWKPLPELFFVVDEDSDNPASKGQYIFGALSGCDPKTGKIDRILRVKRVKSWRELEIGEVHHDVKVVWRNE